MVKIQRTRILLTKAEIESDIKISRITLSSNDNFHVSLPNDNDMVRAVYRHVLKAQDGSVKISLELMGYYKVDGMTSEADVGNMHVACYKDIFNEAQRWIHEQAELIGIPNVMIQMDQRELDPTKIITKKNS